MKLAKDSFQMHGLLDTSLCGTVHSTLGILITLALFGGISHQSGAILFQFWTSVI